RTVGHFIPDDRTGNGGGSGCSGGGNAGPTGRARQRKHVAFYTDGSVSDHDRGMVSPAIGQPFAASVNGGASSIETAVRHVLPNGLVALIQRNPSSPTVSVRGEVRVGAVDEPAAKNGLATFTGAALIRG